MTRVLDMADPSRGEEAGEFQGRLLGAGVSAIVVDAPPGGGSRLHRHPYEEVFVVPEGSVTFTAGDEVIEATGGQVVVVLGGVAHKFVDSGTGRLKASVDAVATSENPLGRLQTPFDHVQQALSGVSRPRAVEAAQGTVDEEHRQAVHRRPSQKLRARATLAGQHACLDEVVQRGAEQLEGR